MAIPKLSVSNAYEVYRKTWKMELEDMTFYDKQMALLHASMEPLSSAVWVTLGEDEEQAQEPKT
jgi:hypothetical protein